MQTILQKNSPILRKESIDLDPKELGTKKIENVIKKMKEALSSQDDGVAIAAPQIGYNLNIFIISKKAFEMTKKYASITDDKVFINPKIKKLSKEKREMEEGCLSVRYLYGKVLRSNKAVIEAMDETGKVFEMGASGLIAQIFQHETDHLKGILFIDKAKDLQEVLPEK